MLALLLSLVLNVAPAGQLAGVTMPDTATVGGQPLVLNGMGLREKFFIDVYVGGLYLPSATTDASSAIDQDVPKRLVMHFVYNQVTRDQLVESFVDGLDNVPGGAAVRGDLDTMCGLLEDVHKGDQIQFDYAPGVGTQVFVRGGLKGTIAGADFMRALWGIYLGSAPPTAKFKRGLLGG